MIKLKLLGDPISNNSLYKAAHRGKFTTVYMSKEGKALKESYSQQARQLYSGEVLVGLLKVEIDLFFGNKRRHDYDNYGKLINDSLTGIVWEDDSQVEYATIRKHYDKENPRIEISIQNYEEEK